MSAAAADDLRRRMTWVELAGGEALLEQGDPGDGGTFDNFPVEVMRARRAVGRVIGVGLNPGKARRIDLDVLPGTWALLRDRWRGRTRRRYRQPSLTSYLMNVTIRYSTSRQCRARELTDLYLCPPLERVGMLEWHRFDAIERQGGAYAREALPQGLSAAQRAPLTTA